MTHMGWLFIYCRISADQQGRAEGVQAQEKWGRAYAVEHWPGVPIKVFADNDLSAAKEDVHRPQFEKMREAIRRGECAQLWVVEQSRLTRIKTVWFEFAAELVRAGITKVHTRRNGIVDVDDVVSDILAVLDANEIKKLRKRLLDKQGELAAQGRPGGRLGYGYRQIRYTKEEARRLHEWQERRHQANIRGTDMRQWKEANPRPGGGAPILDEQGRKSAEIVPEEAKAIQECARRLLDGWGIKALATWLNDQGLRGKHGGRFVATSVADFLTAPCVAGLRVHHGEIVGKATWEPILDEATWRAVCAVINARRKPRRRSRRTYLLTGYRAFCTCDKPMQAGPSGDYAYYRCDPHVTDGCGLASIDAPTLEKHVAVQLFKHLDELNAAGMLPQGQNTERRTEIVNELQGLEARRGELAEMWTTKKITTEQFGIMNAGLTEEQNTLERELAGMPEPTGQTNAEDLRAAWPEMTLDEKRKCVDDCIERITIRPEARNLRHKTKRVSQVDVARLAGVSQGFVSLVIRGTAKSAELERRVHTAIDELGYEPGAGKHRRPATNKDRIDIDWR